MPMHKNKRREKKNSSSSKCFVCAKLNFLLHSSSMCIGQLWGVHPMLSAFPLVCFSADLQTSPWNQSSPIHWRTQISSFYFWEAEAALACLVWMIWANHYYYSGLLKCSPPAILTQSFPIILPLVLKSEQALLKRTTKLIEVSICQDSLLTEQNALNS